MSGDTFEPPGPGLRLVNAQARLQRAALATFIGPADLTQSYAGSDKASADYAEMVEAARELIDADEVWAAHVRAKRQHANLPAESHEAREPTNTALAAKAFLVCIDNGTYRRILRTRAVLAGWAGARGAGLWDTRQSDAVAEAALDGIMGLLRTWAAECDEAASTEEEVAP